MKSAKTILTLAILVALVGCASHDEAVYVTLPPTIGKQIIVYRDSEQPDEAKHWTKVADLSFVGAPEDGLKAQRFFVKRAQQLGGDAIHTYVGETGVKGGGTIFQTTTYIYHAQVIKFN